MKRALWLLLVLVVSLGIAGGSADSVEPALDSRPGFSMAPGTNPQQNPPSRKKKEPAAGEDDQDRPKGQTAISVAVDLVSLQVLVTDPKGNVLTGLKPESVLKKMKSKGFARSVNREDIVNGAADLGVDLKDHIEFVITAMQGIASQLGL